jgi:cytochrome c oxidase subunit 2
MQSRLPPAHRLILVLPLVVVTAGAAGLAAPAPRVIEIVARRFAFEPAEVQVAVGEPVRLQVHSADGLHGIAIKKLKINKDIPRGGEVVTIDFTAKEAGRFPIMCSEYCGEDHENMQGMLVVSAPGEEQTK